jgi:CheY-like chemotaxis protein
LIEDDAATRYAYRRSLEQAGYTVQAASNCLHGLNYLRSHPGECSLVLLDLVTPQVDGWQFLSQCRGDAELRQLPVIVVTGALEPEDQLPAYQPRAILHKPVDGTQLVAAVTEHYLRSREPGSAQ